MSFPLPSRAAVLAGFVCLSVACSSSRSPDPPPLVSNATTDDATVTLPADDVAKAAGIASWTATLRQTDDVLPGAIDVDLPANSARVAIEIAGLGPKGQSVVVGRFAVATAPAFTLRDDATYPELAAVVAGTFLARAKANGSRGDALDEATEVALFRSFSTSLAAWTPDARAPRPEAMNAYLRPNAGQPGPGAPLQKMPGCTPADRQLALHELGTILKTLATAGLPTTDPHCVAQALATRYPNKDLAHERPDLFGVQDMGDATALRAAGIGHVRGSVDPSKWPSTCDNAMPKASDIVGTDFNARAAKAQTVYDCVFGALGKTADSYEPSGDAKKIDVTLLVPNLPGYVDATKSPDTWTTFSQEWEAYACASIAAGEQHGIHVFELWNEPDGIAKLPATYLVPMLTDVINSVRNDPSSPCYDKSKMVQFAIGAATPLYYNQILGTAGGVDLIHDLAYYNLHPYNNWPTDQHAGHDQDPAEFHVPGQSFSDVLKQLATDVMPITGTKPITFSEWGYQAGMPACEGSGGPDRCDSWTRCPDTNRPAAGCAMTDKQCSAEAAEVAAFYDFFSNPPADVAQLAGSVASADMYGYGRKECRNVPNNDVATMKKAAALASTEPTSCAVDRLREMIGALRSTQSLSNLLCCKDSLDVASAMLSNAVKDALPKDCTCFTKNATQPYRTVDASGNPQCTACPAGGGLDTIVGCDPEQIVVKDKCVDASGNNLPNVWYCSELVKFSAYHCKDGVIELGVQCPDGQEHTCADQGNRVAKVTPDANGNPTLTCN